MPRFMCGILALAGTVALLSCAGPPREVLEAANLDEALELAAQHSGLVAVEFWSEG